jgi:hypothetical protein
MALPDFKANALQEKLKTPEFSLLMKKYNNDNIRKVHVDNRLGSGGFEFDQICQFLIFKIILQRGLGQNASTSSDESLSYYLLDADIRLYDEERKNEGIE